MIPPYPEPFVGAIIAHPIEKEIPALPERAQVIASGKSQAREPPRFLAIVACRQSQARGGGG